MQHDARRARLVRDGQRVDHGVDGALVLLVALGGEVDQVAAVQPCGREAGLGTHLAEALKRLGLVLRLAPRAG